jgi:hypothetical protein
MLNSRLLGMRYLRSRPAYADQLLTDETRLVIEGFPRSANSFARFAVHVSQGSNRILAGHNHSSAFVLEAVRLKVPTIVIVRDPASAVASLVQGEEVPLWLAFRAYERFYRNVLSVQDHVVLVPFEAVTNDFDGVLQRARDRFGVDLDKYDDSEATRAEVKRLVARSNADMSGGRVDQRGVALPSASRRSAEDVLRDASPRDRRHLASARALFERLNPATPPT